MRKLSAVLMLLTALACDKDDDPGKFTSINGYWIVRTPDDATNVTFRVIQDADKLHTISNVAVRHNGVDYNSKQIEGGLTVVSAREIESITMFNNSFIAPFFVIRFQENSLNVPSMLKLEMLICISVKSAFTEIS